MRTEWPATGPQSWGWLWARTSWSPVPLRRCSVAAWRSIEGPDSALGVSLPSACFSFRFKLSRPHPFFTSRAQRPETHVDLLCPWRYHGTNRTLRVRAEPNDVAREPGFPAVWAHKVDRGKPHACGLPKWGGTTNLSSPGGRFFVLHVRRGQLMFPRVLAAVPDWCPRP